MTKRYGDHDCWNERYYGSYYGGPPPFGMHAQQMGMMAGGVVGGGGPPPVVGGGGMWYGMVGGVGGGGGSLPNPHQYQGASHHYPVGGPGMNPPGVSGMSARGVVPSAPGPRVSKALVITDKDGNPIDFSRRKLTALATMTTTSPAPPPGGNAAVANATTATTTTSMAVIVSTVTGAGESSGANRAIRCTRTLQARRRIRPSTPTRVDGSRGGVEQHHRDQQLSSPPALHGRRGGDVGVGGGGGMSE
jgi:hypothetical protein